MIDIGDAKLHYSEDTVRYNEYKSDITITPIVQHHGILYSITRMNA